MTVHFMLVQNRAGMTRLAKFYEAMEDEAVQRLKHEVHSLVNARSARMTNIITYGDDIKLVYRRYAGLFFVLGIDLDDNELEYLELIHLLVEVLDMFFKDVCELDLVFNFHKVFMILDELIAGGEIQEVSRPAILERLQQLDVSSS